MDYNTSTLCDVFADSVDVVEPMFVSFGGRASYGGEITTIKCFEDKLHIITNLGSGEEISIKRMIETVAKVSGKEIKINWDTSKPNGTPRKLLDVSKLKQLGWNYTIALEEGIKEVYTNAFN